MKVGLLGGGNPHALAVARHLRSQDLDVFGIGRGPAKPAPLWLVPEGYRYYQAHLGTQKQKTLQILDAEKPDVIFNFAAQGEGAASFKTPWAFYHTNCVILSRLMEKIRTRKYLKRFVHISTSELYGSGGPFSETDPVKATSPYAISKAAFDLHLETLHRVYGFPMQIVRPSNCVTSGMQLHRIVPRASISAVYGQKLQLRGNAKKSYLDSQDLAEGLLVVLEKGTVGETYNVGPTNPISMREVVELVASESGVPFGSFVEERPSRLGEDALYWLSSEKIRSLGWLPAIPLRHAVSRVVEWVRKYPELATMPFEYRVTP